MVQQNDIYWNMPINELLERFQSSLNGISNDEAKKDYRYMELTD